MKKVQKEERGRKASLQPRRAVVLLLERELLRLRIEVREINRTIDDVVTEPVNVQALVMSDL